MFYYKIAELTVRSFCRLGSFDSFACEPAGSDARPDVVLEQADRLPGPGGDLASGDFVASGDSVASGDFVASGDSVASGDYVVSGDFVFRRLEDGWFFYTRQDEDVQRGLYVSADYTRLRICGVDGRCIAGPIAGPVAGPVSGPEERMVRIALECMLARRGYVSMHSAAVELHGEAYVFAGPSGIGKSTRAGAWIQGLGAKLISGDRPLIRVRDLTLYGVPWDGKERCFRNVCYPLRAVCEVQRAETVYAGAMSFEERRKMLVRQCFMPMWDTETALIQMENIMHLAAGAEIVRIFSGGSVKDACLLYDILQKHSYSQKDSFSEKNA